MTPRNVINRINSLHEKGFNEIVLTGIHLSSYGKDISSSLIDLLSLLKKKQIFLM